MLDSESMQAVASGDIAMSIEGLSSNGGLGNFGLSAANIKKGVVAAILPPRSQALHILLMEERLMPMA